MCIRDSTHSLSLSLSLSLKRWSYQTKSTEALVFENCRLLAWCLLWWLPLAPTRKAAERSTSTRPCRKATHVNTSHNTNIYPIYPAVSIISHGVIEWLVLHTRYSVTEIDQRVGTESSAARFRHRRLSRFSISPAVCLNSDRTTAVSLQNSDVNWKITVTPGCNVTGD